MGTNRPDIYINPIGNTQVGGLQPSSDSYYYTTTAPKDGVADAQPQLQADIDYCIRHGISALFLPEGTYKINNPIILSYWNGTVYSGFALTLFGEGDMWDVRTSIVATYSDRFILAVQHGKGVRVNGIRFLGVFSMPTVDETSFYNYGFGEYSDGVCRDSRYSPYAAIVIDPFTNGGLPPDGGYPGMSSWYRGNGNAGGSTNTQIKDCITERTVVGICSSPNGTTLNAEITLIENHNFRFHKLALSGGQAQEKGCVMRNFACWYDTHTIFATGIYGSDSVGDWTLDGGNIAGRINTFVYNIQAGYFPTTFKNIFAESLGRWGTIANIGRSVTRVENCKITWAQIDRAGIVKLISGYGEVIYDGCVFRYYGQTNPLLIDAATTFRNCIFSGFPIITHNSSYPRFIDCRAQQVHLGLTGIRTVEGGAVYYPYGNWTLDSYVLDFRVLIGRGGLHNQISSKSQDIYMSFQENHTVTVSGTTATFTATDPNLFFLNSFVKIDTKFGMVTGITGNVITVSYVQSGLTNGSYAILSYHPVWFTGTFIGDVNSTTNTITNCRTSTTQWGNGFSQAIGLVFRNPYGGSDYIKITSFSGTTLTFSGSITTTKTGAIFGNYSSQEIFTDYPSVSPFPAGYLVRRGDKIIENKGSENSIEYIITKGGFLSGDTDARQATPQIAY